MKTLIVILLMIPLAGSAQTIVGKWTTIDDNSGKEKSVVEIFEKGGKYFGKVTRLFRDPNEDPDPVCDECDSDDPRYKKKIIGMEIIREMEKSGDEYTNGDILDPENGKVYKCKLWIEDNELKVRGYWGPFFRTQSWRKTQ
jgi:uncharacterized protein (DUF2147 family)